MLFKRAVTIYVSTSSVLRTPFVLTAESIPALFRQLDCLLLSHYNFNLHSPTTTEANHFLISPSATWICSSLNCLFILCHVLLSGYFFPVSMKTTLSLTGSANISPQIIVYWLLMASFAMQKIALFMQSNIYFLTAFECPGLVKLISPNS